MHMSDNKIKTFGQYVKFVETEANIALNSNAVFPALFLCLSIPDICTRIEYSGRDGDRGKVGKQAYIEWVDKYTKIAIYKKEGREISNIIESYNNGSGENDDKNSCDRTIDGELLYKLRCSLLHSGIPEVDGQERLKNIQNKIKKIAILIEDKNSGTGGSVGISSTRRNQDGSYNQEYAERDREISAREICEDILLGLNKFIQDNQGKLNKKMPKNSSIIIRRTIFDKYEPCDGCCFDMGEYDPKQCPTICKYGAAIKALEDQKPVPFSIDQLQKMAEEASDLTQEIPDRWIWIEILHHNPQDNRGPASSAFYQVYADHTKGRFFCCGHPGRIYGLSYNEYGENWLAYAIQPK